MEGASEGLKPTSICDVLTAELEHDEREGLRLRPDTGKVSENYDFFFDEAMRSSISPRKRAVLAANIIKEAFQCGYQTETYVERLRQFCQENGV
ncbi:hypothetical protein HZB90_00920 [archaeon]|nr:hypothetical protein [archaeon]